MLDITVGTGFPSSGLLIGVMLTGSGGDMMSSVRLTQTSGAGSGSATATVATSPGLVSEFFTLTGVNAGDTFTLYLTKTSDDQNPNVCYTGLTFDTLSVPEPSTLILAILACGMLMIRRIAYAK